MTLFYPDVANVNWSSDADVINFLSQLRPQGFAGVAHKVSQGSGYHDPYWPAAKQWCEENAFPHIGYHYLDTSDPDSQAECYVNNGGTTNVMFDFERESGGLGNFWLCTDAFNNMGINVQLGYIPNWYLNTPADEGGAGGGDLSCFPFNGVQLVSSAYPDGSGVAYGIYAASGGDSGEGWDPYNGCTPAAWQFTDSANIAGFTVDCNAYKGANIHDLFGG
jgi:hypothetical protein